MIYYDYFLLVILARPLSLLSPLSLLPLSLLSGPVSVRKTSGPSFSSGILY